jgi:glutathione S-transferase
MISSGQTTGIPMHFVVIVAMLALLEYMFFGIKVGQARGTYGIQAPATTGNEVFERYYRVQMNTLEQLVIFLPALVAFAFFVSATWAAALGALFVVGRAVYYAGYIADPGKRGPGFLLGAVANIALVIGALIGAVLALL